jgi:putative hydrolase of the HAD superfamily
MGRRITTIGFDADDTLWQNETFYRMTQDRFAELLADYTDRDPLRPASWRRSAGTSGTTGSASRASCCR